MPVRFIDILGSCLSIFGIIYGLSSSFCSLLPHNVVPLISALLKETKQLIDRAEALNVIPLESDYKTQLDLSANQFARMRMERNHARGFFAQLWLVVQRSLSCRLYALYYRVKALKSRLQLAIDDQQKQLPTITESAATRTTIPSPAAASATPAHDVAVPILPPSITARQIS